MQIVFLTTTLRPSNKAEFCKIIKVSILKDCYFCRCTSCPNIVYLVEEYNNVVELTKAIQQLVAKKLEEYVALAKIVVYSSSIETTKALRDTLDCYVYYKEVGSVEEKEQIVQQFYSIDRQVIVATNTFGLGIDKPDI